MRLIPALFAAMCAAAAISKAKLEVHKAAGLVGIDVSKTKHFAAILDPAGQTIQPPFSFGIEKYAFT